MLPLCVSDVASLTFGRLIIYYIIHMEIIIHPSTHYDHHGSSNGYLRQAETFFSFHILYSEFVIFKLSGITVYKCIAQSLHNAAYRNIYFHTSHKHTYIYIYTHRGLSTWGKHKMKIMWLACSLLERTQHPPTTFCGS